ncbi:MT0933-like antitoxin protein [Amycolatopsis xylanica]|uniref:MT0933-like antitoxin protein n=1 Tax=Amycolatopsis xylanica TaxID=589385 RepID=A0A1H2SYZ6_9PSEU|nr:antitoxin [Amycolatopsis xylanica]SDW36244.1 MT0933-like antitoxin protein [Amycolatopsis xylanica]
MPSLKKLAALAGTAAAVRSYAKKNPEKVNKIAGQAAEFVDKRTKGKYHGQIGGVLQKVRNATDPGPAPQ